MTKKEMMADLKRSGLSQADITKLKMKPLTAMQTKKAVGKSLISYIIPYFDINGKKIDFYRLKLLENEVKFGKEIKTIKYSQPKDTGTRLYMPPSIDWNGIAKDTNEKIVFTEGEKKAAKACKEGLPCIGLGGVWSFKSTKKGKLLIDDFKHFDWKERNVYLIFDSDLATNPDVMKALNSFSKELSRIGAYVFILYLPAPDGEKVGLDDYLLKHSIEDLEDLEYEEYNESKLLWELNDEIAIIEKQGSIITLNNMMMHSKAVVTDLLYADRTIVRQTEKGLKVISAANEWVKWPMRRTHTHLEYDPGKDVVLDNGALNVWEGWGCEQKKGTIKPFLNLVKHIIPDDKFREWFMMWLAYPIQNPGVKMFTSVLVHGTNQGTGKSFIGYIMGKIYGKNFKMVEQEDINGDFNEWAVNKQFIMGEEITGSDKRRDSDKLKNLITRETLTVKIKFLRPYDLHDRINYYFTSQHCDAFFLEDADRRNAIYETEALPMEDEEYETIDKWYRGTGPSHLFNYLHEEVDCSNFNPKSKAPSTAAKQNMIELSRSDLDSFAISLVEDADHVLVFQGSKIDRDLFTVQELVDLYDPERRTRTTHIAMSKALRRAGFKQLPSTVTLGGSKRLWSLRNIDSWNKASHHERVANYDKSVIMLNKERKKFKENKKEKTK